MRYILALIILLLLTGCQRSANYYQRQAQKDWRNAQKGMYLFNKKF